jgi:hypothetical protein
MENSVLLSDAQRAAQSGPNKISADKIRADFPAMSKVSLNPYFSPKDDSASDLPDALAIKFPRQLQYFLPEEQQQRLVNNAKSFGVNFLTSRTLSMSQATSSTASLKPPVKKRSKVDPSSIKTSTKSNSKGKKSGPGQGKGGGRLPGSKVTLSPTTHRMKVVRPSGLGIKESRKRLLAGADVTPASTVSGKSDEASAARFRLISEEQGTIRRLRALEKAVVTHVKQLRELLRAREGEVDSFQSALHQTAFKDFKIYRAKDVPEPEWFTEIQTRLEREEADALTSGSSFVAIDDV